MSDTKHTKVGGTICEVYSHMGIGSTRSVGIAGIDVNTAARREWLASIQGGAGASLGCSKTALILAFFMLAYGVVGHLDYEDELMRIAELDAYTNTLATCQNERFLITANEVSE